MSAADAGAWLAKGGSDLLSIENNTTSAQRVPWAQGFNPCLLPGLVRPCSVPRR
jgi:hypothetical protein